MPHDVETVLGYYVDGELVEAGDVQHRRANVDFNVKRGLPLYTPVRKNLRRAEKLLRNMSVVAEIQSAIALIRKHRGVSRSGVEQFVAGGADATGHQQHIGPHAAFFAIRAGHDPRRAGRPRVRLPATGVDAASFVAVLQAELRAIASRLVMPEFMFTSDASNANFASTMVAEGPAVRMFERLQAEPDRARSGRDVARGGERGARRPVADATCATASKSKSPARRSESATNCAKPKSTASPHPRHPLAANLEPAPGARLRSGAEEYGDASHIVTMPRPAVAEPC